MVVWQGVAMDYLKYHLGLPCPTLLRPAAGPVLKQPYSRYRGGPPARRVACSHFLRLLTPHAVRLWLLNKSAIRGVLHGVSMDSIGVRRGVSEMEEEGRRLPALGVAHPQDVEGSGMAAQVKLLGVHGHSLPYAYDGLLKVSLGFNMPYYSAPPKGGRPAAVLLPPCIPPVIRPCLHHFKKGQYTGKTLH
jgi:hypothetical protein